jgi:Flp pilus assembly protein TadG
MPGRWFHGPRRFLADQRGGVSVMLVLMLIPIIAVLGMATEASSWFLTQRAMQNAADSAAIAAASNACAVTDTCHTTSHTPTFVDEAASVATSYGFTDALADTTVSTVKNPCPADNTQTCYWVTITKVAPINLVRLVGFNGDADVSGGGRGQTIGALSVASAKFDPATFCILSLDSSGTSKGIDVNGGSGTPLAGCSLGTNGHASCNQVQGSIAVYALNAPSGCSSISANDKVIPAPLSDPYEALKSNIPVNPCSTYPGTNLTGGTTITLSATPKIYCGNLTLNGDVGISGTGLLVIENGALNLANHKLTSGVGAGVTIIFTAPNPSPGPNASKTMDPNSKGTLDIAAPTSGNWAGVAVYTNPDLKKLVTYKENGNSSTIWNITGLIYMPHATVTLDGNVNKATNGVDCFALVDDTFTSNGGVKLLEHQTKCAEAGLVPPKGGAAQRQALVR